MAGKKRSGLNKIGAALLALGEGRSDASTGAAPLPLYHPQAHVLEAKRSENQLDAPRDKTPNRRAG
jgi:hypothetical protein